MPSHVTANVQQDIVITTCIFIVILGSELLLFDVSHWILKESSIESSHTVGFTKVSQRCSPALHAYNCLLVTNTKHHLRQWLTVDRYSSLLPELQCTGLYAQLVTVEIGCLAVAKTIIFYNQPNLRPGGGGVTVTKCIVDGENSHNSVSSYKLQLIVENF